MDDLQTCRGVIFAVVVPQEYDGPDLKNDSSNYAAFDGAARHIKHDCP